MKEIYKNIEKESIVHVMSNEIHSLKNKTLSSTGIRVYEDDCIGIAGAQGSFDEKELVTKAQEMLKMKIPYPYELSADRKESVNRKLTLPKGFDLLKETQEILKEITAAYPQFILSHEACIYSYFNSMQNDLGLDLVYEDELVALNFVFKHIKSSNIMDGFFGYGGREYDRKMFVNHYQQILKAYLNEISLPEQDDYPVIFLGEGQTTAKLDQDLSGRMIGTTSSLLTNKIGQQVFSKDFTLYQTNNSDDTFTPFFDMEGVVNKGHRIKLIDKGTVLHGYTDKKTAQKYNMPLTGAATGSYDGIPRLAGVELHIEPSEKTLKELLNGKHGILVMTASGGDFTNNGEYASPVQLAFLTDGENLIGRLPELNIKSNVFDMFGKDFIGVSKDFYFPLSLTRYLVHNMKVSKIY